jgi:membrane protease subunit (stomatin/prohibitin family)
MNLNIIKPNKFAVFHIKKLFFDDLFFFFVLLKKKMSEFTIELGSPLHLNEELWCLFVDQMKQVANYCHQIGFYLFFHLFTFFFIFFPLFPKL